MSCSGEIVAENDLLQIKPAVTKKLGKQIRERTNFYRNNHYYII